MSTKRKTIYVPRYEGAIEGYVNNFLRANFWRVAATMQYEDVTQEAYVVFLRLAAKYGVLDTPQHFMALFKTAWFNHFTDLTHADSKHRQGVSGVAGFQDSDESTSLLDLLPGDLENAGYLATLLRQAPEDVRKALQFYLTAPAEVMITVTQVWSKKGKRASSHNQMLCNALGIEQGTDVLGQVTSYLLH